MFRTTTSETFRLSRKFLQTAEMARTQAQFFARTPHKYPPSRRRDKHVGNLVDSFP
jgi:hypothetical protein